MKSQNVSLDKDKRKKLAMQICSEIKASEQAKGSLPDRWKKNQAIFDVDPGVTNLDLIEGMPSYNLPIVRQKGERICGSSFDSITSLSPYVQLIVGGGGQLEAVERDLMTLSESAMFDGRFKRALQDAFVTDHGFLYPCPVFGEPVSEVADISIDPETMEETPVEEEHLPVTGFKWKWVSPNDMAIYPTKDCTVADAKTIGHRFDVLLYRAKADVKSGKYYKVELTGAKEEDASAPNRDPRGEDEAVSPEDEIVTTYEVVTETSIPTGKYARYLATVAYQAQELLSLQHYPEEYGEPWYVEFNFLEGDGCVWHKTSIAQTVQGNQLVYNDLITTLIQGAFASAFPNVYTSGINLQNKVSRHRPGSHIEVASADFKVQVVGVDFNGQYLTPLLEIVEQNTDSLTGINRLGEGENLPAATKATAIDALMQAMSESKDMRTDAISDGVERAFKVMWRLYKAHYDDLKATFGDRLTATWEDLQQEPSFVVTGRTGASNGKLLLAKLGQLMEMAADPMNGMDRSEVVKAVVQALHLPMDDSKFILDLSPQQWQMMGMAMQSGVPMQAVMAVIKQSKNAPNQAPDSSLAQGGPGMAVAQEPLAQPPGNLPSPATNGSYGPGASLAGAGAGA